MSWLLFIVLTFHNTEPPTRYIIGGETTYTSEDECTKEGARMAEWLAADLVETTYSCVVRRES